MTALSPAEVLPTRRDLGERRTICRGARSPELGTSPRRSMDPAIGKVWDFIRSQPGLWNDGHNVFVYHHARQPGSPFQCDFGVEVTRVFETTGEVYATETPRGEAVAALYRGSYEHLNEAYDAIDAWMAAHQRESGGHSSDLLK
jgi:effector-binding domain-containing protein